jgi:TldD protein
MRTFKPMTRRDFVATTSLAAAGSVVLARDSHAQKRCWYEKHASMSATAFLPDQLSPETLRGLAATAVEAARSAGAQYADVRVAESQRLSMTITGTSAIPEGVDIFPRFTYGVRVLADGAWAFRHGTVASTDALAIGAREAIATARGYASVNLHPDSVPRRPVVNGHWDAPCELDPFTVPLMDQCALAAAYANAVGRVRNGSPDWTVFQWQREIRVFAATDGSCVTQTLRRAEPRVTARVALPHVMHVNNISMLPAASGGYECVTRAGLEDEIKQQTEDMAPWVWLPQRTLEVGRYPVVMDGGSVGITFARTLGRATELDRVVGHEMGGSGGSYVNPPSEMLGNMVANPLLTVTAHRRPPAVMAAKWDDDGVETTEFPLIRDGRLTAYAMSCRSAATLSGESLSNGCAVAEEADDAVMVRLPHFTVAPGGAPTSLPELYRDIRHGVYVHNAKYIAMDSTFASGLINPNTTFFEIRKGRLVSILRANTLQFSTPRMWKSLEALGDATTVRAGTQPMEKGLPRTFFTYTATAPAARFKELDVVSTRR